MRSTAAKCGLLLFLFSGATLLAQQVQAAASQPQSATGMQAQSTSGPSASPRPASALPKHKLGPFEISVNWRTRAEGWNWFEGNTGNSDYGFWHSQLRVGIGQTGERVDWFLEGEQVAILGLPNNAVVASPQGQLGLGGTYYIANNNNRNPASGFLKQGFVNFKHLSK